MFIVIFYGFSVAAILLTSSCAGQEDPVSYVSLGDSLAVGVGASEPSTTGYVARFESSLERSTGRPVNLVQLGLSGETSDSFIRGSGETTSEDSHDASQLGRATRILEERPDSVVTISLGANDLLAVRQDDDSEREAAVLDYERNLDRILTELEEASGGEADITVLDVYNPVPDEVSETWVNALNDRVRKIAQSHDAKVAAVNSEFAGRETIYTEYPEDFHPNDRGYRAIAHALKRA